MTCTRRHHWPSGLKLWSEFVLIEPEAQPQCLEGTSLGLASLGQSPRGRRVRRSQSLQSLLQQMHLTTQDIQQIFMVAWSEVDTRLLEVVTSCSRSSLLTASLLDYVTTLLPDYLIT